MKIANCVLLLFAFLVINGACQEEKLSTTENKWIGGVLTGFKIINQIVDLLIKLQVTPNNETKEKLDCMNEICGKIDDLKEQLHTSTEQIMDAVYSLKNFVSMAIEMNDVRNWMNQVDLQYQRMELMSRSYEEYENSTKEEFAHWNTNPGPDSISSKLFNIFFTYFGYQRGILSTSRYSRVPLVDKIAQEFEYEVTHNLCPSISAQQHFYRDLIEMTLLEIRGHMVNVFSWTILREMNKGEFTAEENDSIFEHERRTEFMTNKLRDVISKASKEIRRCDPDNHKLGETYDQLTRIVQGYIVNEININHVATCTDDCQYHYDREVYGCNKKDWYCPQDQGTGKILRCESETKNDRVTLCPSSDPARRYEYFETNRGSKKNNYFYGERESCQNDEILIKSWKRGFYHCGYCFCLMDEKSENSDRFFNLREVVSDVEDNMVVTGVRFIKENRVFYLQIQQGFLGPIGLIDSDTVEWKDLETYQLADYNDGDDYATLDSDHKSINLDSIVSDNPEHVVTGVRFEFVEGALRLAVRFNEFDFETGMVNTGNYEWVSNNDPQNEKLPLQGRDSARGPNVSTRSRSKSEPSSANYDVVEFTHSDKKDDASQTTLPFVDIQDVVSDSATWLSGVGIYHKGSSGYGGYIAPKIFVGDTSHYI